MTHLKKIKASHEEGVYMTKLHKGILSLVLATEGKLGPNQHLSVMANVVGNIIAAMTDNKNDRLSASERFAEAAHRISEDPTMLEREPSVLDDSEPDPTIN